MCAGRAAGFAENGLRHACIRDQCSSGKDPYRHVKTPVLRLKKCRKVVHYTVVEKEPTLAQINTKKESKVKTPKLVDMGVSVLWADRNIGAKSLYDYGVNYNWGVTDISGNEKAQKSLSNFPSDISGTEYDIATVNYGDGWKMPSIEDFRELVKNCEIYTHKEKGVAGYILVSKVNGNQLFLPNYKRYQIEGDSTSDVFSSDTHPVYWTSNCIKSYNGGFVYAFDDRKDAYRPSFYLPIRAIKSK
jgi:hypothetical protein